MTLPINIEKLIKGEVVETGRIEYKSGLNPVSEVRGCINNFPDNPGYFEACFGEEE